MLKRFFPKQPNFFHQLSQMSDICSKVGKHLAEFANETYDSEKTSRMITDLEHEADAFFRTCLQLLTDTFITPIEREHLHSLFLTTDDVVDAIHGVSQRIHTYRVTRLSSGTREMILLTVECVELLHELIHRIDEIKEPAELHRVSREINRTASKVNLKMQQALMALYESGAPMPAILKERDLIILIQAIVNSTEKVTVIMEEILLDRA